MYKEDLDQLSNRLNTDSATLEAIAKFAGCDGYSDFWKHKKFRYIWKGGYPKKYLNKIILSDNHTVKKKQIDIFYNAFWLASGEEALTSTYARGEDSLAWGHSGNYYEDAKHFFKIEYYDKKDKEKKHD